MREAPSRRRHPGCRAAEGTARHLLHDRLNRGLQPSQLCDGILALVVEVGDLRNGAFAILLDALQIRLAPTLGLIPYGERAPVA